MTVLVRLTAGCERGRRPRPGQAMILLALVFVVLMGSLGLALDGGYNFAQRRVMQNAADAAALAGAQAVSANRTDVLDVVQAVAIQNGVQDAAHVIECTWINNQIPYSTLGSCTNSAPASNVAGVRVTVTEEHPTFVMGVLGIRTASTSATATAQVQIVKSFTPGPFTVCGIDTVVEGNPPNNHVGGILKGSGQYFATISETDPTRLDYSGDTVTMAPCGGPGTDIKCERTKETNNDDYGEPDIPDTAYYFDWGMKVNSVPVDPLTNPIDHDSNPNDRTSINVGPKFRLFSAGSGPQHAVAYCNIKSANFKGINEFVDEITLTQGDWSPPYVRATSPYQPRSDASLTRFTNGANTNVAVSVIGINGCPAGQPPNNCVLLLPLIDSSGPGGSGNTFVAVRKVIAVYITQSTNGPQQFYGQLIKNYQTVGPTTGGYTSDTDAPIMIRLVQ